jgi:hypothetical protein
MNFSLVNKIILLFLIILSSIHIKKMYNLIIILKKLKYYGKNTLKWNKKHNNLKILRKKRKKIKEVYQFEISTNN